MPAVPGNHYRYDRPDTFFYLDPPYFNRPYYKFNFNEEDYVELARATRALQGPVPAFA